jgi:hypothetical protein
LWFLVFAFGGQSRPETIGWLPKAKTKNHNQKSFFEFKKFFIVFFGVCFWWPEPP